MWIEGKILCTGLTSPQQSYKIIFEFSFHLCFRVALLISNKNASIMRIRIIKRRSATTETALTIPNGLHRHAILGRIRSRTTEFIHERKVMICRPYNIITQHKTLKRSDCIISTIRTIRSSCTSPEASMEKEGTNIMTWYEFLAFLRKSCTNSAVVPGMKKSAVVDNLGRQSIKNESKIRFP